MWRYVSSYRSLSVKGRASQAILLGTLTLLGWLAVGSSWSRNAAEEQFQKEISNKRQGLQNVESKLNRQKQKAQKMEKEENYILFRLSRLNKAIDSAQQMLEEIRDRLDEKIQLSKQLSLELEKVEDSFAERKVVIAERLVGLYKSQRLGYGNIIWSSQDFPQFWRRLKLIKQITAADARLFGQLKDDYHAISQQKSAVEKSRWEISHQEEEKKKTIRELKAAKGEKDELLNSVRKRQKIYLQAVSELEAAAQEMKTLIARLRDKQKDELDSQYGTSPLYQNKNRLPWPTDGKIMREFGRQKHPEFGTYYDYQGIDIIAAAGQPVRVIADGTVRYADWFRGYGKVVIIDHKAGFFTLYGHLAEIKVQNGAQTESNQIIGTVGDTGSMNGAYLYFEIRQDGKQVNPRQWLTKK